MVEESKTEFLAKITRGHLLHNFLCQADAEYVMGPYDEECLKKCEGYLGLYIEKIKDGTETSKKITEELNKIVEIYIDSMKKLNERSKDLGYLDRKDLEKEYFKIEQARILNIKSMLWSIHLDEKLYNIEDLDYDL